MEQVLHACTEDRSRVEEIDHLLATFADTDFIDPAFAQFWTTFRSALAEVPGEANA